MAKIFIASYGCSANMNDGEIMAGLLEEAGHKIASSPRSADAIIINTCIVKAKTESRMRNIISKFAAEFPKKKLIIAGCMPQVGITLPIKGAAYIGPHNIHEISQVVEGKKRSAIGSFKAVKAGGPKKQANPCVNIIQILEGCSGACAYCIVKQAKPVLCSFPDELIIKDVAAGLKRGAREVWLTSQDNASYQLEQKEKCGLARLLERITKIEGNFRVRLGMMNPDTIQPMLPQLIEAYKSPKVFKFLHMPVQAGNNRILKLMNRKYTVEDFKKIITRFRKEIPDITISTDIIVGFPTETEAEFMDSMRLLKWLKPDVLNLSRYFPRPNTPATRMDGQVHGSITKIRSEKMARLFEQIAAEKNKGWLGWKGDVLVDEKGKPGTVMGRNPCYKPVVIKGNASSLGRLVKVRIAEARTNYLIGEVLRK